MQPADFASTKTGCYAACQHRIRQDGSPCSLPIPHPPRQVTMQPADAASASHNCVVADLNACARNNGCTGWRRTLAAWREMKA
eukprot:1147180-Pelagomonas_calceolata.AAC.1